jgi:hypothetical protein
MNRADAVTFVAERYGEYLTAVERAATDAAGKTLKPVIDDALRALGYAAADIPTAAPTDPEDEEDLRVQVAYRAMAQIVRDLGATFNLSSQLGSLSLYQIRQNAEKDLAEAKAEVLARFGTTGVVPSSDDGAFVTLDLNFLEPSEAEYAELYG